jgi:hypothetical protein
MPRRKQGHTILRMEVAGVLLHKDKEGITAFERKIASCKVGQTHCKYPTLVATGDRH